MRFGYFKGHTYSGKRADRNWLGRFPRRTIIHIKNDVVTYCRNERDTPFKFYEVSLDSFERWTDKDRTLRIWRSS